MNRPRPVSPSVVDQLRRYVGTYKTTGYGEGICPTGLEFQYTEEFTLVAETDWINYNHRAVGRDGEVLHTEAGVIRNSNPGAELALAMNSGRLEHGFARFEGDTLYTESETFHNDRLGVIANARSFAFSPEGCIKRLWLANAVWPTLQLHMTATLERVTNRGRLAR